MALDDRLKIRILLYDRRELAHFESRNLRHLLQQTGHVVEYAAKDLHDLGMDATRVAAHVRRNPADAWVVNAAPHAVLEWFAGQPVPAFALFGQKAGLAIAGASPRKIPALLQAVRRLAALGHRRIRKWGQCANLDRILLFFLPSRHAAQSANRIPRCLLPRDGAWQPAGNDFP